MNELLRELEEDIRNEKLERLWNSFGKLMITASVTVIVVTIATVIWHNHKQDYAMAQTSQFIKGLDRFKVEDYKGAIAVFGSLTDDGQSPYYGMSMLHKARAEILSGDKAAAAKTYQELAQHPVTTDNEAFVDLAKILAANTPDKVIEPRKDSPFYYTQDEWKAWQLMEKGNKKAAIEIFTALRDDEHVPGSQRERITQVLQHLGVESPLLSGTSANE